MTEILEALKSPEIYNVVGYEVSSFKNAKLNHILREINGYGYKVIFTDSSLKMFQHLAWTDPEEKIIAVLISSIIHHNSLRKKFNLTKWDLTEAMVHELSHVIDFQEIHQPVILPQGFDLDLSGGYSGLDEVIHSEWFWHIYHRLCKKYHVRYESHGFVKKWRKYLLAEVLDER